MNNYESQEVKDQCHTTHSAVFLVRFISTIAQSNTAEYSSYD